MNCRSTTYDILRGRNNTSFYRTFSQNKAHLSNYNRELAVVSLRSAVGFELAGSLKKNRQLLFFLCQSNV